MPPESIIDTGREERQGFPEVVYGKGKTPAQISDAMRQLIAANGHALATGVTPAAADIVRQDLGLGDYDACSRLYRFGQMILRPGVKPPAVISAGTSDQSVAEEAAQTLEFCGYRVIRVRDVGVAGLQRLLDRMDVIREASVLIVVAGMEGALASVVGGLVSQPVIAVPTSVGYGASFGGLAALLAMLNSCAAGVTVTNIDNGFGAAIAAHRILR
jgi:pyridinium-3,5-biscarboxylic acid mononucleotide synthase